MPFHPLYGIWSAVNHPIPGSRISVEKARREMKKTKAYTTILNGEIVYQA